MHSQYGRYKGKNGAWMDQSNQKGVSAIVDMPQKVFNDQSKFCLGCPYPRHGNSCYDSKDGSCLRMDMMKIEQRGMNPKTAEKLKKMPRFTCNGK